jgi:hypothetical protein
LDSSGRQDAEDEEKVEEEEVGRPDLGRMPTLTSMTSRLDDTHFAVLPHGERLRGWTTEERDELNDHVRHLLHSRREKFKRGMKGFGHYVRKREFYYQHVTMLDFTNKTQPSDSS